MDASIDAAAPPAGPPSAATSSGRAALTRIVTGLVTMPLLVLVAWVGGWVFASALALVVAFALWEFGRLVERAGARIPTGLVILAGAAMPLVAMRSGARAWPIVLVVAVTGLAIFTLTPRYRGLTGVAHGLLGVSYVGGALAHLVLLRQGSLGVAGVLLVFAMTWACDTAAYFVGTAWGRRRPWPTISPSKSVEGSAAGLAGAVAAAWLCRPWLAAPLTPWLSIGLGLVVGVAAQLGDLVESAWKRDAAVKDSSSLLPGHGGMLDRFDSMMWSAPATYYALLLLGIR